MGTSLERLNHKPREGERKTITAEVLFNARFQNFQADLAEGGIYSYTFETQGGFLTIWRIAASRVDLCVFCEEILPLMWSEV